MRRRVIAIFLIAVMLFCTSPLALAHDDQSKHDEDLKYALFGERDKSFTRKEGTAFAAIADAAALSIDQFSPNVELKWKNGTYEELNRNLSNLGLPELSMDFSEIDLNANIVKEGNVTANTHRRYTHLGWNYDKYPYPDFWNARKSVLVDVTNRVLFYPQSTIVSIPWIADLMYSPSEQCEAFSAVVYYIHILGDHIEGDDPTKLTDLEPLIQYASLSTPGIITELQEQLSVLFASQRNTRTFMAMQQNLTDLRLKVEQNCGMWGAVDTKEKCSINQKYANELLDILAKSLPILLHNESFFSNRFD